MTQPIITRDRITALSHLSRWRGWTTRPFSVGEHTAIGAYVLAWFKRSPQQIKCWWMHDMHETEVVGDVPTPDKSAYMNTLYDIAVEDFDRRLGDEMGIGDYWWRDVGVKNLDRKMLIVENDLIALRKDPNLPAPDYDDDPVTEAIKHSISIGQFDTPEKVIQQYNNDAKRFGWGTA